MSARIIPFDHARHERIVLDRMARRYWPAADDTTVARPSRWCGLVLPFAAAVSCACIALPFAYVAGSWWWLASALLGVGVGLLFG
jgi:hypothetical protein